MQDSYQEFQETSHWVAKCLSGEVQSALNV